jgi:hypothetical protein
MATIREAMDAFIACNDGESGYRLMCEIRDSVKSAIESVAIPLGCTVSGDVAGSGSYYINVTRYDSDGCLEVDLKIRVSDHQAKYSNDWSFVPGDSDKSIELGLSAIRNACQLF